MLSKINFIKIWKSQKPKTLFCLQFAFLIRGQLSVCAVAYAVPYRRHRIYQKSDNDGFIPVDRICTSKLFACPCKRRCRLWIVVLYLPVHTSRNASCGKKM